MDQPGKHIPFRGSQPDAADRMRELLARTVQDHVADQRSNADSLEHIRRQMEGLEWLVKEVRERELPGLTSRLDTLSRYLDEAAHKPPSWAESLAEHIDVLRIQLAPVADLRSMWADVGTVSQDVGRALPQLEAVGESIAAAVETLRVQDERLTRLHQSVGKLQMSMESAAGRFNRLDEAMADLAHHVAQLDKVKGAMDGMTENVAYVGGQVDLLRGQVQAMHGRLGGLDEGLAGIGNKLDALDIKLTGTDNKIGFTDTRVAALDTRLERLDERLDDQYDRLSAIDSTLEATDSKIGVIGSTIADADTRIGLTETTVVAVDVKLDALAGTLAAELGPVDHALNALDRKLGAVDSKVGTLGGRMEGLDGRLEGVGARLDGIGEKFSAVDGRLETSTGRFAYLSGQLEALGQQVSAVAGRVDAIDEQLTDQLEPLADELRSRPGHLEVQEVVAKIVDAAQNDMTAQLGSLEETVLTLAEALLRPQGRPVPAPRESAHS